jgi:dTDP-4-dehydrorhamnose reductase
VVDGQLRLEAADGKLIGSVLERVNRVSIASRNVAGRRILLLGKNGQVGWELERTLAPLGTVMAVDFPEVDLADADGVRRLVREARPEIIVNAAAYTAVDRAEAEPDKAMAVNGIAPGVLAEEAARFGALLVHYSTDYVFDGRKRRPYIESDSPSPINVYGKTKLAGDLAILASDCPHIILRTSWIYGLRGVNFLLKVLAAAEEERELRIVTDQVGCPTWCRSLAVATAQIISRLCEERTQGQDISMQSGIYHCSARGQTSWHGFAKEIIACALAGHSQKLPVLLPIRTQELQTAARRPAFSVLSTARLEERFGLKMSGWRVQLRRCLGSR